MTGQLLLRGSDIVRIYPNYRSYDLCSYVIIVAEIRKDGRWLL